MTGAYVRIPRDGKWENIEFEHLTNEEREEFLNNATHEEYMKWVNFMAEFIVRVESYVEGE